MNSEIMDHQPKFKSLTGRNLMEYTFRDTTEVYDYQFEMITNNPIPGMLKSEVIRIDGEIRLSFDITSLIPLKKLFERREFSRKDFFRLLKQMISIIALMEEYLLDSGGIILDSEFIFGDPQDLRMEFAYVPLKEMPHDLEPLKSLLLDSIIHDIRFKSEPSDDFIQRLIELLKTQELKISTLKKYINDMEAVVSPVAKSFDQVYLPSEALTEESVKEQKPKMTNKVQSDISIKQKEPINTNKTCFPSKSFIILVSAAAAYLVFGIALCLMGFLSINSPDFILSLFGYLLIGGALSYLLYSKIFIAEMQTQKIIPASPNGQAVKAIENKLVIIPSKNLEYVNKSFKIPEQVTNKAKNEAACAAPAQFSSSPQKLENQDRTMVLDGGTMKHPYLKGVQGEIVMLTHFPFMLGRLEEQVDYCLKNPAIGKLHAELKNLPEGYFATDMNSRNGTFMNGERLEPSHDYKLEAGSIITFANEEFIFNSGEKHKN